MINYIFTTTGSMSFSLGDRTVGRSLHVSGTHVPIFTIINYTFTTTGSMSFSLGHRTVGRSVRSPRENDIEPVVVNV